MALSVLHMVCIAYTGDEYPGYIHELVRSLPSNGTASAVEGHLISRLQLTDESFLCAPSLCRRVGTGRHRPVLDYMDRRMRKYIHQEADKTAGGAKQAIIHRASPAASIPTSAQTPRGRVDDIPEHWEVRLGQIAVLFRADLGSIHHQSDPVEGTPVINPTHEPRMVVGTRDAAYHPRWWIG